MTARRKSVLNVILAAIALLAIIVGTSFISQTAKAESSVAFEQGAYTKNRYRSRRGGKHHGYKIQSNGGQLRMERGRSGYDHNAVFRRGKV